MSSPRRYKAFQRYEEQDHIAGPYYVTDEEDTVRAEGVASKEDAEVIATALELRDDLLSYLEIARNALSYQHVKEQMEEDLDIGVEDMLRLQEQLEEFLGE